MKLDRGSDQRLVVIEAHKCGKAREVYRALCSRWTANHLAVCRAVERNGATAVVRVDGSGVSILDLGINEAFS